MFPNRFAPKLLRYCFGTYLQPSMWMALGFIRDGWTYKPQPQVKSFGIATCVSMKQAGYPPRRQNSFSTVPVLTELMSLSVSWTSRTFIPLQRGKYCRFSRKFIENFNSLIPWHLPEGQVPFSSSYIEYRKSQCSSKNNPLPRWGGVC